MSGDRADRGEPGPCNFRQYPAAWGRDDCLAMVPSRCFYHDPPDVLVLEAEALEVRPGRVLLAQSPFFPGGGGQLADRGVIRWAGGEAEVTGFEAADEGLWHVLDRPVEPAAAVQAAVDPGFRQLLCELHTATHVLNACVFGTFDGALVTGAQMLADGTARMDFDLPDAENDRLRGLEPALND